METTLFISIKWRQKMKVKIESIQPNPFKKWVNEGKLEPDRIELLKESITMGTLPTHFYMRKNNGGYELVYGHHRLEAFRQSDIAEVEGIIKEYSDEQMLIDMVRENLTQRDTDYHDTAESIKLARSWLQSKAGDVKQFNNMLNVRKGKQGFQSIQSPDSYRSIAIFLSKNGKVISYVTVKNYLDIEDKLAPDLKQKIKKGTRHKKEFGQTDALHIVKITEDPDEQRDLIKALSVTKDKDNHHKLYNLQKYKEAPDEIKQKVRKGEIDIANVEDETIVHTIKKDNEEYPRLKFIPNFTGRLKSFEKDILLLEKHTMAFKAVFHDEEFKVRYQQLNDTQKKQLKLILSTLQIRIKKCCEEIQEFTDLLDKESIPKLISKKKGGKNK